MADSQPESRLVGLLGRDTEVRISHYTDGHTVLFVDSTGAYREYSLQNFVDAARQVIVHFAHDAISGGAPIPESIENFLENIGAFFRVAVKVEILRSPQPENSRP